MNFKKLALVLACLVLVCQFVASTCTVTFDKESYSPSETITAAMVCSSSTEKSDAYVLNWTYQNGTTVELDLGTTPATPGESFYQSFEIPSSWPLGVYVNATLQGTDLEGTDSANVTGASANSLLITNVSIGGKWLGLVSSVQATVKDENGKKISGGMCKVSAWSNDESQMLLSSQTALFNGELKIEGILDYTSFEESKDYSVKLACYCGSSGSATECVDEDGAGITNSIGYATSSFTTNDWLTLLELPQIVYANGTDFQNPLVYAGYGERVYIRYNFTSNYPSSNIYAVGRAFLVNNETGDLYEDARGIGRTYGINQGNNSFAGDFEIGAFVPSGVYFVRAFIDTYYNNLLVSQAIIPSEAFNVSGTEETFGVEGVYTNKNSYYTGDHLHICANISNNFDTRVEFEILYNYRCGENNSHSSTERSLLGEYKEFRAISPGISQFQCASLDIPYENHLLYKTTSCYASVTVKSPYINTFDNKKSITGSVFNVTDFGMYPEYEVDPSYPLVRLFPDWRRFDDLIDGVSKSYYRAKINITALQETTLDPEGIINDSDWDVYTIFSDKMPDLIEIYNFSGEYLNGSFIDNSVENKALTWKHQGELYGRDAIGIENVNFSDPLDDYFVLKVWFEDFEERQTEALENQSSSSERSAAALEGIENKTGTFHLDVNCPSQGNLGEDLTCNITAQVEDSQIVEKEVDFTCYITGDGNIYSSTNFNQMVNRTSITLTRDFPLPTTLSSGTEYILQCYADYYNFGSRKDSFYDTFYTSGDSSTSGSSSSSSSGNSSIFGKPSITGKIIGGDLGKNLKELLEGFNPISANRNWGLIFIELLILTIIILYFIQFYRQRQQDILHIPQERLREKKLKIFSEKIILISSLIIIFAFAIFGFVKSYQSLQNYFSSTSGQVLSSSLFQDPLFRGMLLTLFVVLIIVFLFKTLNIQVNIKMGEDYYVRKFHEDKKISRMQNKINKIILKKELNALHKKR